MDPEVIGEVLGTSKQEAEEYSSGAAEKPLQSSSGNEIIKYFNINYDSHL